jgi:diadenosine tetraphosphatase ApaH/serine/threonine PP2A family protein phosphatase
MVSFDSLPLCATLSTYGNEIHFAVHGGISPEIENLYEIRSGRDFIYWFQ